jgi:hypothetical protein
MYLTPAYHDLPETYQHLELFHMSQPCFSSHSLHNTQNEHLTTQSPVKNQFHKDACKT